GLVAGERAVIDGQGGEVPDGAAAVGGLVGGKRALGDGHDVGEAGKDAAPRGCDQVAGEHALVNGHDAGSDIVDHDTAAGGGLVAGERAVGDCQRADVRDAAAVDGRPPGDGQAEQRHGRGGAGDVEDLGGVVAADDHRVAGGAVDVQALADLQGAAGQRDGLP